MVFHRFQFSTLAQVAGGVFIAGTAALYAAHRYQQGQFRKQSHYIEALRILKNHTKATSALGLPIGVGDIKLADRNRNYLAEEKSRLRVPVTGKAAEGFLNVRAVKSSTDKLYSVVQLELELNNGPSNREKQSVVIYDNGRWPGDQLPRI